MPKSQQTVRARKIRLPTNNKYITPKNTAKIHCKNTLANTVSLMI
jgi:hypothetical protein